MNIKFVYNEYEDKAFIFQDCSSEDGWVIEYNSKSYDFKIWGNSESHSMGNSEDYVCDTLEEAYKIVSKLS